MSTSECVGSQRSRRSRARRLGALAVWIGAFVVAAPASAQNLLTNPNFDSNVNGWGGSPWTFDGGVGSPAAGSARLSVTVESGGAVGDLRQCVDGIVPGATYSFGGQFFLVEAPGGGTMNVEVMWNDDPGCLGLGVAPFELGVPVSATGSWLPSQHSVVAPPGAVSAIFLVIVGWEAVGPGPLVSSPENVPGDYTVLADSLFFQPGSAPVPTMDVIWLACLALMLLWIAHQGFRLRRGDRPGGIMP